MRLKCLLSALIIAVFSVDAAMAQVRKGKSPRKSHLTRKTYNNKATSVRGHKAKTVCPVFETSEYPYHGFGFKLGDPFALTYKYYASKQFSVAVDFGKPASGLYNRYFRDQFKNYVTQADSLSDNASFSYSSHRVRSDLVGEVKLLYALEADKISPGLQVYAGIGWQWKTTDLDYFGFYNVTTPNGGEIANEFRSFRVKRVTMGPQAVLGIEYAYFQIPISAFMEIEYYSDIQADPGWSHFEGGVGLRYVF